MWDWDGGHMDGEWSLVMMLGMMGFWVALVAAIVFAIVWSSRTTSQPPTQPLQPPLQHPDGPAEGSTIATAEQILAERFARGEIDADEYRDRLAALNARSKP